MNWHVLIYDIMFVLSMVLSIVFAALWKKHMNVYIALMFAFIPIGTLGQVLLAYSTTLEEALLAQKMLYIDGSFELLFILLCVYDLCGIKLKKAISLGLFLLSIVLFLCSLTIGQNDMFYKSQEFVRINGEGRLVNKVYGPVHTLFYVICILFFAATFAAIVYGMRNKTLSHSITYALFIPVAITFFTFFGGRLLNLDLELKPLSYVIVQISYLMIISRLGLYDIKYTGIDSIATSLERGLVSLDSRLNYLASDAAAKIIIPELADIAVDCPAEQSEVMRSTFIKWAKLYENNKNENSFHYKKDDKTYLVNVTDLCIYGKKRGYQFFINDDTKHEQYIELLDRYNKDLEKKVAEKTHHIIEMHENLILSMATMVESRDNSTGGHIRRTSEGVRILMDEIIKDNELGLDEEFCRCIIKAAPMHDLGKIAVDDAVLRKPGRFTPEEFEKMKAHAADGARIVREILRSTDDERFKVIAENVAHYHHERIDGSGYPDGLNGDEIPIEARIMAIADVYDALVSKRVYKDSMSFEEADKIIMEGMGRHFDSRLKKYYIAARPNLEKYYSSLTQ